MIEVTLLNKGPMAYKPDVYGDSIIVLRNIGSSSTYKIKNCKGFYILLLFINLSSAHILMYLR